MKYRVHQYVIVRVPADVEANSVKEAILKADAQFHPNDIHHGEFAEEIQEYLVDNLDADEDYGTVVEWRNGELVDFAGRPLGDDENL